MNARGGGLICRRLAEAVEIQSAHSRAHAQARDDGRDRSFSRSVSLDSGAVLRRVLRLHRLIRHTGRLDAALRDVPSLYMVQSLVACLATLKTLRIRASFDKKAIKACPSSDEEGWTCSER